MGTNHVSTSHYIWKSGKPYPTALNARPCLGVSSGTNTAIAAANPIDGKWYLITYTHVPLRELEIQETCDFAMIYNDIAEIRITVDQLFRQERIQLVHVGRIVLVELVLNVWRCNTCLASEFVLSMAAFEHSIRSMFS